MNSEMKEIITKTEMDARNYHSQGLNCAESVLKSFLDNNEIDLPEEIMCMATGFGGGIGRSRHICGAVTGAVMALGTVKGRAKPLEEGTPASRAKDLATIYVPFKEMFNEMEEHFGTVICKEMLAVYKDENGNECRRNCIDTIGYCARKLAEYAREEA
ncbi:MAG: C-GCAxxG-C-C family protein [Anaerovoracaceae bacterium]